MCLWYDQDEAHQFAATPLRSSPPSAAAQLAIAAAEEPCLGEEDH
jgi:hypothetical protein